MYLRVVIMEEIPNELVNRDTEATTEEVDEDHDLIGIRRRDFLAQGAPVPRELHWCQEPFGHQALDVFLHHHRHFP